MSSQKLFSYGDVKNKPHRSPFDLSKRHLFSAKCGELLPVYWNNCLPGDKWSIDMESFTRTQPCETAAFTRLKENVDFFFIPYRLMWRNAHASFTEMQDAKNVSASLTSSAAISSMIPHVRLRDLLTAAIKNTRVNNNNIDRDDAGQITRAQVYKLLAYLGYLPLDQVSATYGDVVDDVNASSGDVLHSWDDDGSDNFDLDTYVSLFPLLAYQKVYYDFYRNQYWEENRPQAYNVDYMIGTSSNASMNIRSYVSNATTMADLYSSGMLTLHYANFAKDLLFGLLPNAQYGAAAQVVSDNTVLMPSDVNLTKSANVLTEDFNVATTNSAENSDGSVSFSVGTALNSPLIIPSLKSNSVTLTSVSQFDVLQLRSALATQRWREIANTGDRTYRDQIEKHFGVKVPQSLDTNCTYIGSFGGSIGINEVVNQNLQEDNQTDVKGKGVGGMQGSKLSFDVKEHGIIIAIYRCVPQTDYLLSGPERKLTTVNISDFPKPEFDKLGLEPVKYTDFFTSDSNSSLLNFTIGYAPRYFAWKTDIDTIRGSFAETMRHWTTRIDYSVFMKRLLVNTTPRIDTLYTAFKSFPSYMDNIFGYASTHTDAEVKALLKQSGRKNVDEIALDQLLISLDMDIYCVRNLDYTGLPY